MLGRVSGDYLYKISSVKIEYTALTACSVRQIFAALAYDIPQGHI